MLKALGIFDLLIVAILIMRGFNVSIPTDMFVVMSIFLLLKFIFSTMMAMESSSFDIGGIIDLGVFIVLIVSVFITLPTLVFIIAAVAIGQKGIISLLS